MQRKQFNILKICIRYLFLNIKNILFELCKRRKYGFILYILHLKESKTLSVIIILLCNDCM